MFTLRQWRKAREKTVAEMSTELGVHPNTYKNWEANPGSVKIKDAYRIADALDIKIEAIDFLCSDTLQKCGEMEDV